MKITHLGPGSKIQIGGTEYEIVQIPDDGGYQLRGLDGFYKLVQAFYCTSVPTVERLEEMIRKYLMVERDTDMYVLAERLGWTVDRSTINRSGPIFVRGLVNVWMIRNGWQCADRIHGFFRNHRPYYHINTALVCEAEYQIENSNNIGGL